MLRKTHAGVANGYLRQPCRRYSREEIGESLRTRATDTSEVEGGPSGHGAMLFLVRAVAGMLRDKEMSKEQPPRG